MVFNLVIIKSLQKYVICIDEINILLKQNKRYELIISGKNHVTSAMCWKTHAKHAQHAMSQTRVATLRAMVSTWQSTATVRATLSTRYQALRNRIWRRRPKRELHLLLSLRFKGENEKFDNSTSLDERLDGR